MKNVVQRPLEVRWGAEKDTHSSRKDCLSTELFFFLISFHSFILFFWPGLKACGILVPRLGIDPLPPAMETWSLNHWTAREIPLFFFLIF